jgi:hypothetical protein
MPSAAPAPSELLSGPDLGGGYLHQLSIDRRDGTTTFTHHAQDGGQDAGGPPAGGLDVLGFAHPPTPCMFGGPRCWHRRYLLPFAAIPKVRFAYQRHRLVLGTMLPQALGVVPTPFEAALRELVHRVADPLRQERIPWYVAGSGAVRLLGGDGEPRDLDLGTSRSGVDRLGELLAEYLIEPVAPTDRPDGELILGARAFVGSPQQGARVEWSVPLEPRDPLPAEEFSGVAAVTRTLEVPFDRGSIQVSRPEYALVRSANRGRPGAVEAALAAVRRVGLDPELLELLLARSSLDAAARAQLRRRAGDRADGAARRPAPS